MVLHDTGHDAMSTPLGAIGVGSGRVTDRTDIGGRACSSATPSSDITPSFRAVRLRFRLERNQIECRRICPAAVRWTRPRPSSYSQTESRASAKMMVVKDSEAPPVKAAEPSSRGPFAQPTNTALMLIILGTRMRQHAESQLRTEGLSLRHVSALGHLARQPGLSYSELARRAGITTQSMQATIIELEKLQAVERRTEPGRGRTAELHVTTVGRKLLDRGHAILSSTDQHLADTLGRSGHENLTKLMVRALSSAF